MSMETKRSKWSELGWSMAAGTLGLALFWALGAPESGWLAYAGAGLGWPARQGCGARA
jgi:hypothetical protein